jgi:transcriptional regulator with GAF, ATPase, and Fis domain
VIEHAVVLGFCLSNAVLLRQTICRHLCRSRSQEILDVLQRIRLWFLGTCGLASASSSLSLATKDYSDRLLATEEILQPEDFALEVPDRTENSAGQLMFLPSHYSVEVCKRLRLQEAIAKAGGSKIQAAKALELQPTYLSRLCKQMGVT